MNVQVSGWVNFLKKRTTVQLCGPQEAQDGNEALGQKGRLSADAGPGRALLQL